MWRNDAHTRAMFQGWLPRGTLCLIAAIGLLLVLALALAPGARGAGTPVNVGTPVENDQPSIAVEGSGDAVIAWNNTANVNGSPDFVQYCVLPVGAVSCAHSGNLIPADSAGGINGVNVLAEGSQLVILADVYGTAGSDAGDYEPVQEWQSGDDGTSFSLVDGGRSVVNGTINANTGPLSAVTVPGSGVLGYGQETAGSLPPTFDAFPLNSPAECSLQTCTTGYASLSPAGNPDQLGNGGGEFASQGGAAPGVLGVFFTNFTSGPLACAQGFGTAYAYGSGDQGPGNDYNVSPGSASSAWRVPVSRADCNVDYSAVDGGPSGFGVLEVNEATGNLVYHSFDQSTDTFDTPTVNVLKSRAMDTAASQDGAGAIYATYLVGGQGGAINLSYSADGGETWSANAINANPESGADEVNSSVNGAGQGWAVWNDAGSVVAESFGALDSVTPATVSRAKSSGKTVTLTATCTSVPCKVQTKLTGLRKLKGHGAGAQTARKKTKTISLGKATVTIESGTSKRVSFRLSGPGKRFLSSKKGRVKTTGLISTELENQTAKTKQNVTLAIRRPKKAKKVKKQK